jgi:hypothetical protein
MQVRFTKNAPTAANDTLTCVRPDGSTTVVGMARQGILPHEAFHFVVETTLRWRDSFFGHVARGDTLEHVTARLHAPRIDASKNAQALQCEALIECLQTDQWGGASDPATFAEALIRTCRRRHVPPPDIATDELVRVRHALREFGAAWRPLTSGQSLERAF